MHLGHGTQLALNSCAPWKALEAGVWAVYTIDGVSTTVIVTTMTSHDHFSFLSGAQHSSTRAVVLFVVCLSPWKASSTGWVSLLCSMLYRQHLGQDLALGGALCVFGERVAESLACIV